MVGLLLTLGAAREWRFFMSTSREKTPAGIEESALFTEAGAFLVRTDRMLFWAPVQSISLARPQSPA